MAEKLPELRRLRAKELDGHKCCGELFAELMQTWTTHVVGAVEELDRFVDEVERAGILGYANEETQAKWAELARPQVLPVAIEFLRYLEMLLDAGADPWGKGYRNENDGGSLRVDHGGLLKTIVPDLRGLHRVVWLSGRFERTMHHDPLAFNKGQPTPAGEFSAFRFEGLTSAT